MKYYKSDQIIEVILMNTQNQFEFLKTNLPQFFSYMKEKYPFYNNSNVFLRDIQYGIKNFFEKKSVKLSFSEVYELAAELINLMEKQGVFFKLSDNTWKLNYSDDQNVNEDKNVTI